MEPVDRLCAGFDQVVAVFDDRAQYDRAGVDCSGGQRARCEGGDTDRYRVRIVVLAAVTGREDTDPGRQLRRDVDDVAALIAQAGGQRCTQPRRAFDRPVSVRPSAREAPQRPVAVLADRHTDRGQGLQGRVDRGCGPRRFVRIDRDHYTGVGLRHHRYRHRRSPHYSSSWKRGGHTNFRLRRPLFSHSKRRRRPNHEPLQSQPGQVTGVSRANPATASESMTADPALLSPIQQVGVSGGFHS